MITKREGMSRKQEEIYNIIKSTIRDKGYPPSVRELTDLTGSKSTSTVFFHLRSLEEKGYIRKGPSKNRSIEVLETDFYAPSRELIYAPLVGKVAAGEPIFAEENIEETFPLPLDYFNTNDDYFMLRISGESMVEAGIRNRDLVIVRQQNDANDGDIVVALIDDSATVKTFYREGERIRLQPENKYFEPIYSDNVEIMGVVAGLFRTYK